MIKPPKRHVGLPSLYEIVKNIDPVQKAIMNNGNILKALENLKNVVESEGYEVDEISASIQIKNHHSVLIWTE